MLKPAKPPRISTRALDKLIPYARNARTHTAAQVAQIAASIQEFGWTNPILVDGKNGVIAGHGRILAARKLGLSQVPVIELAHLSQAQRRAYVLADNSLALQSGWDQDLLELELGELKGLGFDLDVLGIDIGGLEIDTKDPAEDPVLSTRDYGGATSIGRSAAPIKHWRSLGLLNGEVLDFGCGQEGHEFAKYDIVHHPDPAVLLRQWDTVMCNYVLNVQPIEHLITQILVMLYHLAKPGGVVLISVRNDVEKSGATNRGYQVSLTHGQWTEKISRILPGCEDVRGSSFSGFIFHKEQINGRQQINGQQHPAGTGGQGSARPQRRRQAGVGDQNEGARGPGRQPRDAAPAQD